MKNLNLTQIISDASASGREHSFAPQNNYGNASLISKKVQNVKSGQSAQSLLAESGADAQSGRSMIEMLGVLAIIGVLSVGGIAGYSKAMQKYRINKTIEHISLIIGNIQSFFVNQQDFGGLPAYDSSSKLGTLDSVAKSVIRKSKIIPEEIIVMEDGEISKFTNAFGGDLWINGNFLGSDGKVMQNSALLYINGLSEEACIELFTHDWSNISGLLEIAAGEDPYFIGQYGAGKNCYYNNINETCNPKSTCACPKGIPVSLDIAVTACAKASTDAKRGFAIKIHK